MIRILIVEDHNVVRQGLAALIGTVKDMQVVAQASNGAEGVQLFREHHPDVTLMDAPWSDPSAICAGFFGSTQTE